MSLLPVAAPSYLMRTVCTIQSNTGTTRNAVGEPVEDWDDLLEDIPCSVHPFSSSENERPDATVVTASHEIHLNGDYPTITEEMRAVVGSTSYDIESVERSTPGSGITRLLVQEVI